MNETQAAGAGMGLFGMLINIAIIVFSIIIMWKVYAKAGQPGWGCLIPFYNIYLLLKMAGKPGWWLLLFFIPVANIVISIIVMIDIAKNFGKGSGFGIGLVFLNIIFFAILAFGDAEYQPAAIEA
jgi:uncharacterized membrane protein YhaH (DUF805 family)